MSQVKFDIKESTVTGKVDPLNHTSNALTAGAGGYLAVCYLTER